MKKAISLILTFALLLCGFSNLISTNSKANAATTVPYYKWKQYDSQWSGKYIYADVNNDGEIDATDAGLISRYDAGFISFF